MVPSAKVIRDSISEHGNRLTTMEVVMHRFVLAEFNTHRMFSRNSASSRAIPVAKQIAKVVENPAIPLSFPAEQKGMQGGDELGKMERELAEEMWIKARDWAVTSAEIMVELGVHKSVTNRLLEPFMWHTVIVSSTEWQNFWRQRCSPLAQPEMRAAAEAMRDAYDNSTPIEITDYDWHMPYIDAEDLAECVEDRVDPRYVSAARCARVSYLTHDGRRNVDEDGAMYDRLVSADPPHASPLEHVARPVRFEEMAYSIPGNFTGWVQLRHEALGF